MVAERLVKRKLGNAEMILKLKTLWFESKHPYNTIVLMLRQKEQKNTE